MGGLFGVVSGDSCVTDLFFGVDYHSHLGTRRGGMAVYDPQTGFNRAIHNIENSPFRTKFERDVGEMTGTMGIGCISDSDPQPLIVRSHLGNYAITTVGRINNMEELLEQAFHNGSSHFLEMSGGQVNATELTACLINQKDTIEEGIRHAQSLIDGSMTLLLLTKDDAAYEAAREAFEQRTMEKFYTCRTKGCPAKQEAVIHAYLRKDAQLSRVAVTDYPARGALEIITGYPVLEPGEYARLEVELMTGRTHQIRAHLAHIGHPILGDDKYGDRALNRRLGLRRQQLWATRLVFHAGGALAYLDGKAFSVDCPF